MKKFLSVLLALAVAFTFTFGSTMSAFAVVDDAHKSAINTDMNSANATVTTSYQNAVAALAPSYSDGTYRIEAAQAAIVLEAIEKDVIAYNNEKAKTLINTDVVLDDYTSKFCAISKAGLLSELVAVITDVDTAGIDVDGNGDDDIVFNVATSNVPEALVNAYAAQFGIDQATVKAQVESAKTSMYSTNAQASDIIATYKDATNTDANAEKATTYNAAAENVKVAIVKAIDDLSVAGYSELSVIKQEFGKLAYLKSNIDVAIDTGLVTLNTSNVGNLVNSDDEALNNSITDSEKASAKAALISAIANEKAEAPYTLASADVKASLNEWMAAYQTACEWLIDYNNTSVPTFNLVAATPETGDISAAVIGGTIQLYDASADTFDTTLVKNVAEAAKALAAVDTVKAAKNNDGSAKYVAENIETELNTWLFTQYKKYDAVRKYSEASVYTEAVYVTSAKKAYEKNAIDLLVKEPNTTGNATDYYMYNSKNYYDAEWPSVTAAIDAAKAAIDAATTTTELNKAKTDLSTAINKINDTTAVNNLYKTNGILKKTFDAGVKDLKSYGEYLNSSKTGDAVLVFDPDPTAVTVTTAATIDATAGDVIEYFAAKGIRTVDALTAALAEYKAEMASAKSITDLKADAAAVVAKIAALPAASAITTNDKAAIAEAAKAYADLDADYKYLVSNAGTLSAAITAVQTAENKEIALAYAALPTTAKVTIADKAAVKAVADMIEAFNDTEMYSNDSGYNVDALLAKIQKLELTALETALDKVPTDLTKVTLADKAAVDAARAAYDAYLADYIEVLTAGEIATLAGYEKTISDVEALINKMVAEEEAANQWTATDVKASLFDSSRKLTIWRTSKTSIRVTSVGSVADIKDHGYTVEYKFYKKAPGATSYKLVKTTSSNKYTYTNLKKGTNKFQVKVVVKDADGKVVASKWTYYRAAKIK